MNVSTFDPTLAHGSRDHELHALLREDLPHGDLTTSSLGLEGLPAQIRFEARAPMVLAGLEAAARLLTLCGVQVQALADSGARLAAGEVMLRGHGPAAAVLAGWKLAQTLVEGCSGIAGATAAIVDRLRAAGHRTPLACTRKNIPGTRWLAADAVRAGGGVMHRLGLSETLLIFPEHRTLLPAGALAERLRSVKTAQPEKRMVVEVGTPLEALQLARLGVVDVLQLERFVPAQVRALRQVLAAENLAVALAPAGGVNLGNALDFADAGADLLVSSAPLFAAPADVKVWIGPPPRAAGRKPMGRSHALAVRAGLSPQLNPARPARRSRP